MASKRYKRLFALRFVSYFAIMVGALTILFEFGPLIISEYDYQRDRLFGIHHVIEPNIVTSSGTAVENATPKASGSNGFGSATAGEIPITPVSTDFGIVIEKINANSKVIPDVDPANESEYTAALKQGVAEAKGSTPP